MQKMSTKKRMIGIVVMVILTMSLCTGCSNERLEEQAVLREKGIALMEQENYEEALEVFTDALGLALGKIGETEKDICYYKAEAQYHLGDTEGAKSTYTALIDYNQDAKAYFLRGNLYYSLGEDESALKDYTSAMEQDASNYELYMGIYDVLMKHGKEKEAQDCLNQALEISGDTAQDKMQKGRINYFLGEYETAISFLEEAAKANEMMAYYYLAEIQYETGDVVNAKTNMDAYMKSDMADSYNLFTIANNQLIKGNTDIAIDCLNTALELEELPNKQAIMQTLIVAYEKKLDFASAKTMMEQYIVEYPEDEEAQREHIFLQTR